MISDIVILTELQAAIATALPGWRPLVFTKGCFDLLQVGHVRYLQVAKSLGRSLVVNFNLTRSYGLEWAKIESSTSTTAIVKRILVHG
jgi:bifunctional ADP-heptose synthase (sugar kinase/adenylyltransferase)